ncbi:hypothetical protein L2E82_25219 [Cichorium intybus]|uniref:Uncharacterized protein n=1 Tax=Cichorium intybus TaxID=13427 RepID=A0ACB9E2G1_CICIN|nr:hypothetical protein L2E82_25219 [Cichorium intybus]
MPPPNTVAKGHHPVLVGGSTRKNRHRPPYRSTLGSCDNNQQKSPLLSLEAAIAGTRGKRRAILRLSPSAMLAICYTAKVGSHEFKEEKIAPAMAVPVREMVAGFEVVRDLGSDNGGGSIFLHSWVG